MSIFFGIIEVLKSALSFVKELRDWFTRRLHRSSLFRDKKIIVISSTMIQTKLIPELFDWGQLLGRVQFGSDMT